MTKNISELREYELGSLAIKLQGRLKQAVTSGDRIRVDMMFCLTDWDGVATNTQAMPAKLRKYFQSKAFVTDLDESVFYRGSGTQGIKAEYSLPLDPALDDMKWSIKGKPRLSFKTKTKRWCASFDVELKGAGQYPLTQVVGFMAGCAAWHIKSGSIPVFDIPELSNAEKKDTYVQVDVFALNFSRRK